MPVDFKLVQAAFLEAAEQPEPAARAAVLDRHCAGNVELRKRVETLLRAHDQPEGLPTARPVAVTLDSSSQQRAGQMVAGRYKLLEQIGEGGMGAVWVAEQTAPIRRRVAMKLIKPGMDSKQVLSRFEAERQALALMDHPNIAKVYDGGMTDEGRPFFAMEYVKGVPITDYCDQARLPIRERLQLFVPVCQAVQHAHQKGIIHRDLKPSNILVCLYDGRPVPKVIDFGLAKAISQPLTENTLYTAHGLMVGTPLYMSPEQAEFNNLDVDTRTDIYSLGVILYELLTGSTPLEKQKFKDAAFAEILRLIKEVEPPKPSTKLSTTVALPAIAAQRGLEAAQLSRVIRGDLDWIVMKSLEKERARRYETANGLARDVERYLHDEPVEACPPSLAYKFSKFTRRNKRSLVTGSLFGGVVVAALVVMAGSIGWAIRDGQTRQAVVERKIDLALDEADESYKVDKVAEAEAALNKAEGLLATIEASSEIEDRFQQWKNDLTTLQRLEQIQLQQAVPLKDDRFDPASTVDLYRRAFATAGLDVLGMDPLQGAQRLQQTPIRKGLVAAIDDWAILSSGQQRTQLLNIARQADPDSWRNRLRDAVERDDRALLKELATDEASRTQPATIIAFLGRQLHQAGERELALTVLRRGQRRYPSDFWINEHLGNQLLRQSLADEAASHLRIAVTKFGDSPAARNNLGVALAASNKLSEAAEEYREAIRLAPDFSLPHYNLGLVLENQKRVKEAEASLRQAIRLAPLNPAPHAALAEMLVGQRRNGEALQGIKKAVELAPQDLFYSSRLLIGLQRTGRAEAEEAQCRKALAAQPDDAACRHLLGDLLQLKQHPEPAAEAFREAIRISPDQPLPYLSLGILLMTTGDVPDCAQAEKHFRDAIRLTPEVAWGHALLGWSLLEQKKFSEAEAELLAAIELEPNLTSCSLLLNRVAREQGSSSAPSPEYYRRTMNSRASAVGGGFELGLLHRSAAFRDCEMTLARRGFSMRSGEKSIAEGQRMEALSDYLAAAAVYRAVIKLQPTSVNAYFRLVSVLQKQRSSDADFVAWEAVCLEPNNHLTHAYLANGHTESSPHAELALRESLRLKPDYAWAHGRLAMVLDARRQPAEALVAAHEAVRLEPNSADHRHTLGCLLGKQGDSAGAIAAYREELALRPNRANSQEHLGWILVRASQQAAADEQFKLARASREYYFNSLATLGAHFATYGYLGHAKGQYLAQMAAHPEDHASAMRAAFLQLYENDRPAFEATTRQMLARSERTSDPEEARRTLHACLISPPVTGTREQHERLAKVALSQDERAMLSHRERGLLAYRTGDWDRALQWSRESRSINAEATKEQLIDAQNFAIEAMALHQQGQPAEARRAYESAARNGSDFVRYAPHAPVGAKWVDWVIYEILRREATELLAIQDDSDWPRSADRGLIAAAGGDWKTAASEFARACQSPAVSSFLAMQASVAVAMAGDRDAYQRHCQAMIDRFAESDVWTDQERIAKGCLLMEGAVPTADLHVDIVLASLEDGSAPSGLMTWGQSNGALLAYREGQYDRAVDLGERAAAATQPVYEPARAIGLICVALASHKLGKVQVANEKLAGALQVRDKALALSTGQIDQRLVISERSSWHDWMIVELLRREAEALQMTAVTPSP